MRLFKARRLIREVRPGGPESGSPNTQGKGIFEGMGAMAGAMVPVGMPAFAKPMLGKSLKAHIWTESEGGVYGSYGGGHRETKHTDVLLYALN